MLFKQHTHNSSSYPLTRMEFGLGVLYQSLICFKHHAVPFSVEKGMTGAASSEIWPHTVNPL